MPTEAWVPIDCLIKIILFLEIALFWPVINKRNKPGVTNKASVWHSGCFRSCLPSWGDRQTDVGSHSCQAKNRVPKWEKNEKVNTNTPMPNPLSHFCSIHRGLPFLCNHKDSEKSGSLLARPYPHLSTCFIYKIDEKKLTLQGPHSIRQLSLIISRQ